MNAAYGNLLNSGVLKGGDLITVSMEVKSPNSTALPSLYLKAGYAYIWFNGTLSDKFSKVSFTTTWQEANGIAFHLGFAGLVGTYIFKNIKLEKGNKATDWTPAPEDKADENQTINYDLSAEPAETGTKNKTANTLWQNLFNHTNFLWLKLKGLFSAGSATTNDGYIPKIDDVNKKLVKSNIYNDGTNVGIGTKNPLASLQITRPSTALATQPIINVIPEPNYGIKLQQYHNGGGYDYYLMQNNGTATDVNLLTFKAGKVGIGTTTPSEKLDVNGSVKANGYKVGAGTDTKLLTDGGGTKLITDFAQLESGKIKATNLPDYLLGQVLYGGSINSSQLCTFSSLYKNKFNTTAATGALTGLTAISHVGVYFIASGNFLLDGTIDVSVGDWVISDGNAWGKIDNTDAVASVNGQTGVVNLDYGDLGEMPVATDTEVGGIMTGFTPTPGIDDGAEIPIRLDSNSKAYVYIGRDNIKDGLGLIDYNNYNKQDIFISGIPTTTISNNFNFIVGIGSYKVNGTYYNAPNPDCGTSLFITGSMVGSLNVFRSGANDWETIQQLFWVLNGKTEQYQRSYNGTAWTGWKRLIKCDDYAGTGRGGIVSEANFGELFRAPDLIQLWNEDILSLTTGTYYLDSLVPIGVPIENSIHIDNGNENNIIGLTSGRRYRVTYEAHYIRGEGEGGVTIRIENGYGVIYSISDYIFEFEISKTTSFSVIITGTEDITPSIVVGSGLTINIPLNLYQVSVEEIKFPYFTAPA